MEVTEKVLVEQLTKTKDNLEGFIQGYTQAFVFVKGILDKKEETPVEAPKQ